MRPSLLYICLAFGVVQLTHASESLRVSPAAVQLDRPESTQQLIVEVDSRGLPTQGVTRQATFVSEDPRIATVTAQGRVMPRQQGSTNIRVTHDGRTADIPVTVLDLNNPPPVSFRNEVLPILTKAGCNSGGCHGKAEGQNGFKLSIFGYDAEHDHNALLKESRGRRVNLVAVDHSLLLRKGLASTPHGGGQKLEPNGRWHRLLRRWISEGARLDQATEREVVGIEVEPRELIMAPNQHRQLRITAVDSSGTRRCVTDAAEFMSNADTIAKVDHEGWISTTDVPGEAAILVRYMGQVGICRITLPQPVEAEFKRPPSANFIDQHVWDKLQSMRIVASPPVSDEVFLRRVYLDTIGRIPSVEEARAFITDVGPNKREQLIDDLLGREAYADYWALRWADILQVDKAIVSPQGAVGMTRWLRSQFHDNTPYDEFARRIVTARGLTTAESPAPFFQVHKDPESVARAVSQVFLGVRIECAQCHHHPFERWGQEDYFAFAGFFSGVARKKISGSEKIYFQPGVDLKHPRTNEAVPAAGLGASPADFNAGGDRRATLAQWMTASDNPFFARMIANRLWSHYFDRGLVEPIDDMRATNPATNEPLLQALADHLVELKFDLKAFTKTMLMSQAYQLSSQPTPENEADMQNYSHAAWKPLAAEVLLDAICDATEVSENFNGWPEGVRAVQVWDNRMPSYFFQVFGRPQRVTVCECERGDAPSIAQALHLMNSPETVRKIRHRNGRASRLAASNLSAAEVIEELYLATLSRLPSEKEVAWMEQAFQRSATNAPASTRRQAIEDVMWALLNTKEFVYNH